ncbi:unnamed protein product [Closterium sp. Naga37s-1]|nr:unnamed protein product [Closterium sp. Naga37s-1]
MSPAAPLHFDDPYRASTTTPAPPDEPYGIFEDYGVGEEAPELCSANDDEELDPNIGRTNTESAPGGTSTTNATRVSLPRWSKDDEFLLIQERFDLRGTWSGMRGMQGENQFFKLHRNLLARKSTWRHPVSALRPKLRRLEATWLRWRTIMERSGAGAAEGAPVWHDLADQLWRNRETVRPTTVVESGPTAPSVNGPSLPPSQADTLMPEAAVPTPTQPDSIPSGVNVSSAAERSSLPLSGNPSAPATGTLPTPATASHGVGTSAPHASATPSASVARAPLFSDVGMSPTLTSSIGSGK